MICDSKRQHPPEKLGKSTTLENNSESHANQESEFRVNCQNFMRCFNCLNTSSMSRIWYSNHYIDPSQPVSFLARELFSFAKRLLVECLWVPHHSISWWSDVPARRPWVARTDVSKLRIFTFRNPKMLFSKGWSLRTVHFLRTLGIQPSQNLAEWFGWLRL